MISEDIRLVFCWDFFGCPIPNAGGGSLFCRNCFFVIKSSKLIFSVQQKCSLLDKKEQIEVMFSVEQKCSLLHRSDVYHITVPHLLTPPPQYKRLDEIASPKIFQIG